jgi:prophage regulatory protein
MFAASLYHVNGPIRLIEPLSSVGSESLPSVNAVDDLVGAAEIRIMLGNVSRQRVNVVTNHKNFPDPVANLIMGKVWRRSDVEAWIKKHRPDLTDGE